MRCRTHCYWPTGTSSNSRVSVTFRPGSLPSRLTRHECSCGVGYVTVLSLSHRHLTMEDLSLFATLKTVDRGQKRCTAKLRCARLLVNMPLRSLPLYAGLFNCACSVASPFKKLHTLCASVKVRSKRNCSVRDRKSRFSCEKPRGLRIRKASLNKRSPKSAAQ
jgi:hypothetical protein